MRINDGIQKCVAFFISPQGGDKLATCFFTSTLEGQNSENDSSTMRNYAVTAKHVIKTFLNKSVSEIPISINLKDLSTSVIQTQPKDWIFHEDKTVDLAVCPIILPDDNDHEMYPRERFLDTKRLLKIIMDAETKFLSLVYLKVTLDKNGICPLFAPVASL